MGTHDGGGSDRLPRHTVNMMTLSWVGCFCGSPFIIRSTLFGIEISAPEVGALCAWRSSLPAGGEDVANCRPALASSARLRTAQVPGASAEALLKIYLGPSAVRSVSPPATRWRCTGMTTSALGPRCVRHSIRGPRSSPQGPARTLQGFGGGFES